MPTEVAAKPQPMDSFSTVYTTLVYSGSYKLLNEPSSKWKLYLHNLYRFFTLSCLIFLTVQQLAYIALYAEGEDMGTILFTLATEIPQINLLTKYLTLYFRKERFDKLHEVLNGTYFAAKLDRDEEYLKENIKEMNRLMKAIRFVVVTTSTIWFLDLLMKKIQMGYVNVPMILPVDDTWFGFAVQVTAMVVISSFLGMGHIATDCLVATFYAQATTQLKMLKNNLEHMFDRDIAEENVNNFKFNDDTEQELKEHFLFCVKKYDTIVWFTREVNSVFNILMSFQFMTATATTCFVIYILSYEKFSTQFIFLVAVLFVFQTQVFLYCYYGSLVEYESQSVSQAAFLSNWLPLSPRFRRSLLIAMIRWTEPLRTRVSVVVPLSVTTSISIVRSAYTAFTLMSQTAN